MTKDKIVTQIGATSALDLVRDLMDGKLDPFELEAEAKTSGGKKARKWRQVQFLMSYAKEFGPEALVKMLIGHKGETLYLLEDGRIATMQRQLVSQPRRRR